MVNKCQDDLWFIHQRRKQLFSIGFLLLGVAFLLASSWLFVTPAHAQAHVLKASVQPVQIENLKMFSPLNGWALQKDGMGVFVTQRGPAHWTKVTPPSLNLLPHDQANAITSSFFLDAQHAYIGVLQDGLTSLWMTANGGRTWTSVPFDFQPLTFIDIHQIEFTDARHGWLAFNTDHGFGRFHIVLKSTSDGGKTWQQLLDTMQDPAGLPVSGQKQFHFTNQQNGWMTGPEDGTLNVRLYETHNGGKTWTHSAISPVTGSPTSDTPFTESYGPFFSGARNATLVVRSGTMTDDTNTLSTYHTTDGGKTWKADSTLTGTGTAVFRQVTFLNANTGWVLGKNAKGLPVLQRTFDGGRHWTTLLPTGMQPFTEVIYSLTFLNSGFGWTVNKSDDGTETLFQTFTSGTSWRALHPTVQ